MCAAQTSALGLAVLALAVAVAAEAEAQAPVKRTVFVQVMVVQAGPQSGNDDPQCRELRKQLGPMHVGSLRMVQKIQYQLRFGENGAVLLPAGGEIRLTPINIHARRLNMQLQMPGRMDTHLRMRAGKPVIVGGPRYKNGHLLVQIVPQFQPVE
jgi:hypothetical protein